VLGVGNIADGWVASLHRHTDQRVTAVAAREVRRAQEFAARHGIPTAYGEYAALVADPTVDVVYVATTNNAHLDAALLVIGAGKHLVMEKPIALSAAEARRIAEAARAAGVFAMEAMWSRFLPRATVVERLLVDGVLGDIAAVTAQFGFVPRREPAHRVFDPAQGGGALLDVGVYAIWWNHFVLGTPTAVTASGLLAWTGVDETAIVTLDYEHARGVAISSSGARFANRAGIHGDAAWLEADLFHAPGGFVLHGSETERLEFVDPTGMVGRDGLCFAPVAAARHIAEGRTEAPEHPLDRSIAVLETIDAARAAIHAFSP
jgi:predicted dehydrogenase